MRRVVVTGLGMVTPLGCGVEASWKRILEGKSGARKIETFEVSDLPCKIACQIPRGDGSDGTFNPDQWMEPKEQRKVDEFILYALSAARQALDDSGWKPSNSGRAIRDRRDDRLRHRRRRRHCRGRDPGEGARTAPAVALLHSRPHHQSRLRLCVDRVRAEGAEFGGGHRLLDRLACDRRCRAHDRARRCRCDGGGRRGIADRPALAWRALPPAARSRPRSTTRPSAPRVPTTRTATAS